MFSGSYPADDVTFLLRPVEIDSTPVVEKERLIQSGRRHYSEMITRESLPGEKYLDIFRRAVELNRHRFAVDLVRLAHGVASLRPRDVTIVSLARAGTPVGVLVKRILEGRLGRREGQGHGRVRHYSVSIIRDRGIDTVALDHILERHAPDSLIFVDGWTGKGVIARELAGAIARYNAQREVEIDPGLHAVADLCGAAAGAVTGDDYLIPSSVLGATVSGLVSRSILNETIVGPGQFHACLHYECYAPHDLSRWFIDEIMAEVDLLGAFDPCWILEDGREQLRATSRKLLTDVRSRYGVVDENHVKPGIGESTRVLLRRLPHALLLQDPGLPDVEHLVHLASEKRVPIHHEPGLPYRAVALIQEVGGE